MRERHKSNPGLTFDVANVTALLPYPSLKFGSVIDKGTLDSILCGDDSTANAGRMCEQVCAIND